MLNYEVDARILAPFVPPGIELDAWQGKTLASIVAFEFAEVRVLDKPVPCHRDFEEMNLRFYVRRRTADGWRRGVVFVRELVPLPTVALLARLLYGEPYKALPMDRLFQHHSIPPGSSGTAARERTTTVRYSWYHDKTWNRVEATVDTTQEPRLPEPGSEEEFLTDHTYGYGSRRGQTIEYVVEHPTWRYWNAVKSTVAPPRCARVRLRRTWKRSHAAHPSALLKAPTPGEAFRAVPRSRPARPSSSLEALVLPVIVRRPGAIRSLRLWQCRRFGRQHGLRVEVGLLIKAPR